MKLLDSWSLPAYHHMDWIRPFNRTCDGAFGKWKMSNSCTLSMSFQMTCILTNKWQHICLAHESVIGRYGTGTCGTSQCRVMLLTLSSKQPGLHMTCISFSTQCTSLCWLRSVAHHRDSHLDHIKPFSTIHSQPDDCHLTDILSSDADVVPCVA